MASQGKGYDWARAVLSVASANSADLGELARVAELDPYAGDLVDINLSDLDLSAQNLFGWNLKCAKFDNAKLTRTELRSAELEPRELIRAVDWENAILDDRTRGEALLLKAILDPPLDPVLLVKISRVELSIRAKSALKKNKIIYLGDLVSRTEIELLHIPNFGRKCLFETKRALAQMGLRLGAKLRGWPPNSLDEAAQIVAQEWSSDSNPDSLRARCQSLRGDEKAQRS
jgi:hypothetical protein